MGHEERKSSMVGASAMNEDKLYNTFFFYGDTPKI